MLLFEQRANDLQCDARGVRKTIQPAVNMLNVRCLAGGTCSNGRLEQLMMCTLAGLMLQIDVSFCQVSHSKILLGQI